MKTIKGISVSRGISIGPVFQFKHVSLDFETYKPDDTDAEWQRFLKAQAKTKIKLEEFYDNAVAELGTDEAAIFHAHISILEDPDLNETVESKIKDDQINAETALYQASESFCEMLEQLDDEYLRARALDIRDVRDSVLRILLDIQELPEENLTQPSIIVSQDLTPSDCLSLNKKLILGFCTIDGGTTSHTTILARSLGIPALVGAPEKVLTYEDGLMIVLDGYKGEVLSDFDSKTEAKYREMIEKRSQIMAKAIAETHKPAVTQDGHQVMVAANLGGVEGSDAAVEFGAEGVGLLRTEFIYLECNKMPDEEYQYQQYRKIVEAMGDRPVILRTLDIGGDKQLPYLELPYELNPFLGVRGLRLCLRQVNLFKTQLRAALRAAAGHNLQLMFPMVTKASEIRKAKAILEECRSELIAENKATPEKMEVGIMIEIPAAAILANHLIKEIDFFSIGTNDLSQYTLAVDRTNTNLTDLANAFDPAVLTLVDNVIQAAHKENKMVGVCGELAGDPIAIPILLGLGLDEFSMNAPAIPIAKQILRRLSYQECQNIARRVLEFETPGEVRQYVTGELPFLNDM